MNLYSTLQNFAWNLLNLIVLPLQVEIQDGFLISFLIQSTYKEIKIPQHSNGYLRSMFSIELLKQTNFEQQFIPNTSNIQEDKFALFLYHLLEQFFIKNYLDKIDLNNLNNEFNMYKYGFTNNFINYFDKNMVYNFIPHSIIYLNKNNMQQSDNTITRDEFNEFFAENNKRLLFGSLEQDQIIENLESQNLCENNNYSYLLLYEIIQHHDIFQTNNYQKSITTRNQQIKQKFQPRTH